MLNGLNVEDMQISPYRWFTHPASCKQFFERKIPIFPRIVHVFFSGNLETLSFSRPIGSGHASIAANSEHTRLAFSRTIPHHAGYLQSVVCASHNIASI